MKKYLIITLSITNIGGAEQYIYNKQKFLSENGFDVYVFSSLDRKILIRDLNKYSDCIIPELMYSPSCFTKKNVDNVVKSIAERANLSNNDEIYVESHNINQALWAEILGNRYTIKHLIYNIQEVHNYSKKERKYLKDKFEKKELVAITHDSMGLILDEEIEYKEWMKFRACCNNVVDDCQDIFSQYLNQNADLTIGSIGRLEKEFVLPMIDEIIHFSIGRTINLILIGGSSQSGIVEKIKDKLSNISNITLIITGFLYPIPRKLINRIDLFISTAGAATVSYCEKRPTIKVHPINAKPAQIMGFTYDDVRSHSMYDTLPNTTLIEQIELILSGIHIKYLDDNYSYEESMKAEFLRQVKHIDTLGYTNVNHVHSIYPRLTGKGMAFWILGHLFGGYKMQKILEKARRQS